MTSPFGYGTLRVSDSLWPHIDRLKPACMLFIDDAGAATRFANAFPNSVSIYRAFRGDESTMYLHSGEMLKYVKGVAAGVSPNVYLNVGCEEALGGDYNANLKQLVKECIACLDWAYANGRKLALPHGAFYGLNPEHFPILVPLINKINERPDQAILTSDEYFGGHAFSGVVDGLGGEVWHIDPAHWQASPVRVYYHMGRVTVLFRWLVTQGIKPPRYIVTETGADDLSDIGPWLKTLKVTGGYQNIRGWKTLTDQWAAWYGGQGWSPQRAYVEMLKAVWQQVYAPWPNVVGLCLYTWGYLQDRTWEQFDLADAGEFQSLLEQVNWKGSTVPPTPIPHTPPPTTPAVTRVVTMNERKFSTANVRSEPTTAASIIGEVKVGDTVDIRVPLRIVSSDNYVWLYCDTKHGWIADVVGFSAPRTIVKHVALGVPFVTQNRQGQNNLCAEACVAMLARYRAAQVGDTQWANVTALDVAAKIPDRPVGGTTDYTQTIKVAAVYGLTLLKAAPSSEDITGQIDAGLPVIVDFIRKFIPGWQRIYAEDPDGPHLAVADEYTIFSDNSVEFGINDPLGFEGQLGDSYQVKASDLLAGMAATKYAATALLLDAKSIAPMPPPETADESRTWTMREIVALVDARIGAK